LLQRSLDLAAQPIYLIDAGRRIRYVNEACCLWLQKKPGELIGERCNYSAVGIREQQPAPTNMLAPPAEAFSAALVSGEVCGGPEGAIQVRAATFHSLAEPGKESAGPAKMGGAGGVLVIVGEVVSQQETDRTNSGDVARRSVHADLLRLRAELDPALFQGPLIGQSHALRRLREQVKVAQQANVRVLLVGPAGSGRKQLARSIHYVGDIAGTGPLAPVDCPVMDAELMQLTLTRFLRQREGQIFRRAPVLQLTDVDQLRPDAQQELAGFLLLPGVELMTISTASRSLHKLAARGRFRQDLAFALSTFTLTIPPLSRRLEDVPLLAQYFIEQFNSRGGQQRSGLADDALELLLLYSWPGNVQELYDVIRESCERATGNLVTAADLPERLHHGREALLRQQPAEAPLQLTEFLAEVERELLARAMKRSGGNKTKAAELLGLQRARLIRRLVQLGLQKPSAADEEPVVFEPIQPDAGGSPGSAEKRS
jgi:transcriptional regulator with AAA-type ATPase domain